MDTILTTIRKALQTQAQTVPPFASATGQVVLGNYNFAAGVPNFFGNIVTSGPWLFIEKTTGDADFVTFDGQFSIPIVLVSGFASNAPYDFTLDDDIIANLMQVWSNYSEWVQGGHLGGVRATWGAPEMRTDNPGGGTNIYKTPIIVMGRYTVDAQLLTGAG